MTPDYRNAWIEWRKLDRLNREWQRAMKRIDFEIECLATDIGLAVEEQRREEHATAVEQLVAKMRNDRAFGRVLLRYNGCRPKDWRWACDGDGRMLRLIRDPGWDVLREVIYRLRVEKGLIREKRIKSIAVERPQHDATLEIKIKLGAM